ncbi:bifunctional riboflavin kinase/FAD synthetase [Nitrospira moscoviensis]|uniref:Riboflavin biosynthesis protein n=1 Tax=Nitrospira moscoviensis TaxID=42253 RepID=A0A0K2GC60_NITMO|nr:bifunctional riboflavin kinase/FAD synthetase [Nitrospira moscoviensis]ALA58197.1 Riboflavin biosynthesis protein RibF [Nitrospira moscoviensis]
MKITRGYRSGADRPYPVATIGNFDGHHVGHRSLLRLVVEAARRRNGTALVLTFDPHPVKILAPQAGLRYLTSPDEKLARFEEAGIDEVVLLEFDRAFAALSPEAFADEVLARGLGLKELYVGEHFAFGHKRAGKIGELAAFGRRLGFVVHPLPPVVVEGVIVSSTRIRRLIQEGDVRQAATLLGRRYALAGVVSAGAQRGQSLGWPTANLKLPPDRVVPADGVYAAITMVDAQRSDSIAYIGTRPTFDAGERLLEVNLLDGVRDLYGRTLAVEFVERVRGDLRFAEPEALSRQIAVDVERAKAMLRRHHDAAVEP